MLARVGKAKGATGKKEATEKVVPRAKTEGRGREKEVVEVAEGKVTVYVALIYRDYHMLATPAAGSGCLGCYDACVRMGRPVARVPRRLFL